MILGLERISDHLSRDACAAALDIFLRNRAKRGLWSEPFLEVRQLFGTGHTGSLVAAVRYGDHPDDLILNHFFRVLKVGPSTSLIAERDGFSVFNKQGSEYFIKLTYDEADVCEPDGQDEPWTVIEYDDARINASARSLKGLSEYVIEHYHAARQRNEFIDPNPLGENIGDVLHRMFRNLKTKIYGAEFRKTIGEQDCSSLLAAKVTNTLTGDLFEELGGEGYTGLSYRELIAGYTTKEHYLMANYIHGDMNPGNVLLCVDVNGRDITSARLIDYGEVLRKKKQGFTFVFWDAARLTGEFMLDFSERIVDSGEEAGCEHAFDNLKRVLTSLFTSKDLTMELAPIWQFHFHVLIGMVQALFAGEPETAGEPDYVSVYQQDTAVQDFVDILGAFLLFYCGFRKEHAWKRRLALKISVLLRTFEPKYQVVLRRIASYRGEVITRADTRRAYEALERDEFKHLSNISKILFSTFEQVHDAQRVGKLLPITVKADAGSRSRLYDVVMTMKESGVRTLLLTGEGGMGKTTALFYLFRELSCVSGPVPIFLEMQWINNARPGDDILNDNWILNHLIGKYTEGRLAWDSTLSRDEKRGKLRTVFSRRELSPRYLLLLDGYNEVSSNREQAVRSIKECVKDFHNMMVIVTTRPLGKDQKGLFRDFHELELTGIAEADTRAYLADMSRTLGKQIAYPAHPETARMLRNPLYLCLYTGTEAERNLEQSRAVHADMRNKPETPAEILHNFFCATSLKWLRTYRTVLDQVTWQEEQLRHYLELFLPALGWEMATRSRFEIGREELLDSIATTGKRLEDESFLDRRSYEFTVPMITERLVSEAGRRINLPAYILDEGLVKQLGMLTFVTRTSETGIQTGVYRFIHQHFRDFFAARYLLERLRDESSRREGLELLRNRLLTPAVQAMLGELSGEHRRAPYLKDGYRSGSLARTVLDDCLDILRGEEIPDGDVRLTNVMDILKTHRRNRDPGVTVTGDLSDTDLSRLDLRHIPLNGVLLGRGTIGGTIRAANVTGARCSNATFFPMGHGGHVMSAVYAPDGRRILSGSDAVEIKEWDTTGECLYTFDAGLTMGVYSVTYSPDGHKVLAGSEDGTISVLDRASGKRLWSRSGGLGHKNSINSISCSPDGLRVLTASADHTVKEWSMLSGRCLRTFTEHEDSDDRFNSAEYSGGFTSATYSPDGSRVVAGNLRGIIRVWDETSGRCLRAFRAHKQSIGAVAFGPDGLTVFSGSADSSTREWDPATGQQLHVYPGHDLAVGSVACSADGLRILSGSADTTIREWDRFTEKSLYTFTGHDDCVSSAAYSPDGRRVLSGSFDTTIREWDQISGECLRTIAAGYPLNTLTSGVYSPDSRRLLTGSGDKTIKEWDVGNGLCLRIFQGHQEAVLAVDYSPEGNRVLSGSADTTVREWDQTTGECRNVFSGHHGAVHAVVFSPDGSRVLSGSADSTIREWDGRSGTCLRIFSGHENTVTSVAYSPDGLRVLSGSYDRTIREWNRTTGKCFRVVPESSWRTYAVAYSPDGLRFTWGNLDKTVREWSPSTGEDLMHTFRGHTGSVKSVVYSADGLRVFSGGDDSEIREWDCVTGACLRTFHGSFDMINTVARSPDGLRLLSGSAGGTLHECNISDRITELAAIDSRLRAASADIASSEPTGILTQEEIDAMLTDNADAQEGLRGIVDTVSLGNDERRAPDTSPDVDDGNFALRDWMFNDGFPSDSACRTIRDVPGLFIQGLDLNSVHSIQFSADTAEHMPELRVYAGIPGNSVNGR